VYSFPESADVSQVHKLGGDFNAKELNSAVAGSFIMDDAVERYTAVCPGVSAMLFAINLNQCEKAAQQFRDAGYTSETIDGRLDDRTRRYRLDAFADGKIQVIATCQLVEEGTDIPSAVAGIDCAPTQSLRRYMQRIGRLLRTCEGKEYAIQLDHAGNYRRHGSVFDEREWSLDETVLQKSAGESSDTPPRYWQCLSCYAIVDAWRQRCPQCQSERIVKDRDIKQVAGELVRVDSDAEARELATQMAREEYEKRSKSARMHAVLRDAERKAAETWPDPVASRRPFFEAARELGYKTGWGAIRFDMWVRRGAGQRTGHGTGQAELFGEAV
jgi:superfamily II DNA/RNA helicase